MKEPKYGAFSSSVNPEELSKRVEGVLISISAIVIWLVTYFGGVLTPEGYLQQAANIGQIVSLAATAYGLITSFYGFARSVFVKKLATPTS